MLTLLDEAVNEGSFQSNLSKACHDNDLPNIIYTPHPNTPTALFNSMIEFSNISCTSIPPQQHLKSNNSKPKKSNTTKYFRDQYKRQTIEDIDIQDTGSSNRDEISEHTDVVKETPHIAASTLTQDINNLNPENQAEDITDPETHDEIPGNSIKPIDFTLLVKIAMEMFTSKQNSDKNTDIVNNIVAIVKDKEKQINDYCEQGMTIEQAIDKATNIISGIPDCIQDVNSFTPDTSNDTEMRPSDFSDVDDNGTYDDLYDDSAMVYKSKQLSDISNFITSSFH